MKMYTSKLINTAILLIILISFMSCSTTKLPSDDSSKIIQKTIYSKNLDEDRELTLYLPKDYKTSEDLPVVYCTDGQLIVRSYKTELDSLIENNIIPKMIMVGVHSNERQVDNEDFQYRNYEYIQSWSDNDDTILNKLFDKHLSFFSQEIIEYVENNYNVSSKSSDRVFYGTSNGAGFGVSLSASNPSLFDNYICLSMAGGYYENVNWLEDKYPYFYLAYGTKEPFPLVMAIDEFHTFLESNKYKHVFYKFDGGHDRIKWKEEFSKTITLIFNK